MPNIGKPAPDFALEGVLHGELKNFKLTEQRGKWVVLFFYPLDFTFICPTEITGFSTRIEEFKKLNAMVFGASTDSKHSHKAWLAGSLGDINYPLLADQRHEVSRAYGVYLEDDGVATRGTFIIDPDGNLRYALYHDNSIGRNVDETLRVLAALQTGELCQLGWKPGEKTLGKA